MESNVCLFNQYGFCKHGQSCRKRHVEILCDNENCDDKTCEKRHPKLCKFYAYYKRCKFTVYCRYKHCDKEPENIQTLKKKVKDLEKIILDNKTVIETLVKKVNKLEIVKESSESVQNIPEEAFEDVVVCEIQGKEAQTLSRAEPQKKWLCCICDNLYENEILLRNHMDTHNFIPQIDGGLERQNVNGINIGGRIVQPAVMYSCDECNFRSTGENSIFNHKKTDHNPNKTHNRRRRKKT